MNDVGNFGRALRDALGQFATGVTVVTTVTPAGKPAGLTVNSFTSLSLEPPLVLWSLGRHSAHWSAFRDVAHFAVNVLAANQRAIALQFADPVADPFRELQVEQGIGGIPLLPGTLAQFECRLSSRQNGGDHELLIGEVLSYREFGGEPLLFHTSKFGRFLSHPGS